MEPFAYKHSLEKMDLFYGERGLNPYKAREDLTRCSKRLESPPPALGVQNHGFSVIENDERVEHADLLTAAHVL